MRASRPPRYRRSATDMHLHILGICGTFMGGLAAIAKTAGHVVTGCDANVYPPMSTQLRDLGIDLVEGWDASQLRGVARDADAFVIGNVVSRGNPLMEAILDSGRRYVSGPQWLYENVLARSLGAGDRRNAREDDDDRDAVLDPRRREVEPGVPDRRRADGLSRLRAAHRQRILRHRGGRVRHRLLRQAIEVRALPSAHRHLQQSRIRPRGHLPGPCGDRDAVPPSRAHDSAARTHRRQRRGQCNCARARTRRLERGRALRLRGGPEQRPRMDCRHRWLHPARRCCARKARARHARPPQPVERAGGAGGGAPRRRARASRSCGACEVQRGAPPHGGARRRCAASPSTTISRIIRPRSRCRSRRCGAKSDRRASSRCWSRAPTR